MYVCMFKSGYVCILIIIQEGFIKAVLLLGRRRYNNNSVVLSLFDNAAVNAFGKARRPPYICLGALEQLAEERVLRIFALT